MDRSHHDVFSLWMIFGHDESVGARELVVRVGRRRVAFRAAFFVENFFAAARAFVERVGVRRWLQRVNVTSKRIQRGVGVPEGQAALLVAQKSMRADRVVVGARNQRGVASDVLRSAIAVRRGSGDPLRR